MDKHLQEQLPDFVDLLLDAVFLVDLDDGIVHVSAACEGIFGYRPEEMIGRRIMDFVAPEDRDRTLQEAALVVAGQPRIGFENRYIRKDGRRVRVMWSARWSEAHQLRIGVARDVTAQRHAAEMQAATYAVSEAAHSTTNLGALLREIHHIIARLVPLSAFAVAICDRKTMQLSFVYQADQNGESPSIEEQVACRYCTQAMQGGQPIELRDAALAPVLRRGEGSCGCGEEPWLTMPLLTHQEAIGALLLRNAPDTIYSEQDKELLRFVSAQVATAIERRELHAELLYAALYDELTGLPNRRLFYDRIKAALALCRRHQSRIALLYVDVDDFKQINDAFGHAAGDLLLREIAQRLQHCVREADTVARLGGDEFVVLLENVPGPADAAAVADKIRAALAAPVAIGGLVLQGGASVGIALHPDDGEDIEQLLRRADTEMYVNKRTRTGAAT